MNIALGSDHVGLGLKKEIQNTLQDTGHICIDMGTYSEDRTDYPIYAEKVADSVLHGQADRGILICGTGVGIGIAANKINGIRCVTCSEPYSAELSRRHNNTNILSLGARVVGQDLAMMIVRTWLETPYEGGRHQRRIDQITALENKSRIP